MRRIMITLEGEELSALNTIAERERRDPRQQAAVLIRNELVRQGLLPPARANAQATPPPTLGQCTAVSP